MTKNEILDYIMSTPENTNRQVLQYMLDDISGSGGNMPIPEYKSTIIDGSESSFTLDLKPGDIEEVSFIEASTAGGTVYIILDYDTNSGIVFDEDGIIYFIRDIGATLKGTNIVCYTEAWPPQSQPQSQYDTWDYSIDKQYEAYSYQYEGETLNGFITNSAYPAFGSDHNMNLLSFVNIQHADEYHPDFTLSAQVKGVIVDNEFIPINEFYVDWNIGDINKSQSYRYVFSFNGTTTTTTGTVKLTWYGAELRQQK